MAYVQPPKCKTRICQKDRKGFSIETHGCRSLFDASGIEKLTPETLPQVLREQGKGSADSSKKWELKHIELARSGDEWLDPGMRRTSSASVESEHEGMSAT